MEKKFYSNYTEEIGHLVGSVYFYLRKGDSKMLTPLLKVMGIDITNGERCVEESQYKLIRLMRN